MVSLSCWLLSQFTFKAFSKGHGRVRVYGWHSCAAEAPGGRGGGRLSSVERTEDRRGTLWKTEAHRQHHCPPPWISWKTASGCPYGGRSSQTWNSGTWWGSIGRGGWIRAQNNSSKLQKEWHVSRFTSDEWGSARCVRSQGASCCSDWLCRGGQEQRTSSGVRKSGARLAWLVGRTSQQTSSPPFCWG